MSLKEEIRDNLIDSDVITAVKNIDIDRDADMQGRPAIRVILVLDVNHNGANILTEHTFHFAKDNHLTNEHICRIIESYVYGGIDEVIA